MKKTYIWHLVLILYIAFIFSNSLTPAVISSGNSSFVLRLVQECLQTVGIRALWLTEHIIRKCAHFSEYALLGILLFQSMRCLAVRADLRGHIHLAAIFFIPFVDETLQLFTEGRSGQISDVWLDMGGILFGTLLYYAIYKFLNGRQSGNRKRTGNHSRKSYVNYRY